MSPGGKLALTLSAVWLCACPGHRPRLPADAGAHAERHAEPAPAGPEKYGDEVKSLRLKRSIVVRLAPDENAKAIGTVAQDTRVGWTQVASGAGCKRWVEIAPRGWVCDKYLEPSKKPPAGVELPKLKDDELVPGVYGRVVDGGTDVFKTVADIGKKKPSRHLPSLVKVRHVDDEVVDGKLFWKTTEGEYVEYGKLTKVEPSTFVGVKLDAQDAPALPILWAQQQKDIRAAVAVYARPGGAVVKTVKPRTMLHVDEESADGKWLRTSAGWFAAADVHVARTSTAPATTGDDEKWFDVDLDQQVVVAYQGGVPVYATLVSTGSKKWPTPPGIYRIWIKFAETDMNGQMGDEEPYSVATVPWTMFFARDLAFHTAYWHDRFGEARSHGCVNLSPRDARALYFWATPDVPAGWSMVHGIVEAPGSLVRIRSKAVPEPEWKGYAKRVYEARLGKAAKTGQDVIEDQKDLPPAAAKEPTE
jgi:lipoprotein-anchoring transpeptidase ErfK/SrfK